MNNPKNPQTDTDSTEYDRRVDEELELVESIMNEHHELFRQLANE